MHTQLRLRFRTRYFEIGPLCFLCPLIPSRIPPAAFWRSRCGLWFLSSLASPRLGGSLSDSSVLFAFDIVAVLFVEAGITDIRLYVVRLVRSFFFLLLLVFFFLNLGKTGMLWKMEINICEKSVWRGKYRAIEVASSSSSSARIFLFLYLFQKTEYKTGKMETERRRWINISKMYAALHLLFRAGAVTQAGC